jgi:hypothetical protein
MKRIILVCALVFALPLTLAAQQYRGQLTVNPYAQNSISNPYGQHGTPYGDTITNPYSTINQQARNPYAVGGPKLYDSQGNYRGNLNNNPYDPNSVSNPYGQYGSPYSPDSINNPYGAGNPYSPDSPSNPYGQGLIIIGE